MPDSDPRRPWEGPQDGDWAPTRHRRPPAPSSPNAPPYGRRRALVALGAAGIGAGIAAVANKLGLGGGGSGGGPTKIAAAPARPSNAQPPSVAGAAPEPPDGHQFDIVIVNGRVIDPESGYDGLANVGVDGTTVTSISTKPLAGKQTIDAKGRVVAPGFIDLLSYDPDPAGVPYKICDGVTTNLAMHGVMHEADEFFPLYAGKCAVNYGGAFSDHYARSQHLRLGIDRQPTAGQISQLVDICEAELHKGWIGIDFEPEYTPGTTFDEIKALAQVAKKYGMVCTFHGRYSSYDQEQQTVPEIIDVARQTGAMVHVEHVTSTGGTWHIDEALGAIHQARSSGVDITACMYPYDYWATYLGSARFGAGWQDRFHISYGDLQVAGTSDRLNQQTFLSNQRRNKLAVAYAIPESSVVKAIKDPLVMIGSDAIVTSGNNHPRAAGCFARTLGRYVREQNVIGLRDALSKMTIEPAKRFQGAAPALAKKGRLQRGADADITVFDPNAITDRATVENPVQFSSGVDWVLVNGTVVKDPNGVVESAKPGIAITSRL